MILDFIKDLVFTIAGCSAILWVTAFVIESALETFKVIVNNLCATTAVGKFFFEFVHDYENFKLYQKDVEAWNAEQERRAKMDEEENHD